MAGVNPEVNSGGVSLESLAVCDCKRVGKLGSKFSADIVGETSKVAVAVGVAGAGDEQALIKKNIEKIKTREIFITSSYNVILSNSEGSLLFDQRFFAATPNRIGAGE